MICPFQTDLAFFYNWARGGVLTSWDPGSCRTHSDYMLIGPIDDGKDRNIIIVSFL